MADSQPLLTDDLKAQLGQYFEYLKGDIVLEASLDDSDNSKTVSAFLKDVAALSPKVSVEENGKAERKPSFSIRPAGSAAGEGRVSFAGLPLGHEFTSLVLALLQVSGHPPKIEDADKARIQSLDKDLEFKVYFSQSCHNCPDVVQALNIIAVLNPKVKTTSIDGAYFPKEVEEANIRSVPQVFLNGQEFLSGRSDLRQILDKLDTSGAEKAAEKLSEEKPFDVLVVGGGPAGCAASIYSARKGLRTAIVAERFGGQVMDTAEIENFISVIDLDGPTLGKQLEEHVRKYDINIIQSQTAKSFSPAAKRGDLHTVELSNGAKLKAKAVIAATGAHWRKLGVPGEDTYLTKGVAYCPHCDGPFFKGKPIAVAGGGNSGVEAAIDLAGICSHVTLLQRRSELTADEILQEKLKSLSNVTILCDAEPAEILGDGTNMTGLKYKDKKSGKEVQLDVDAIFIQVGLLPNSDWVGKEVKRTDWGEIVIDEKCHTSVHGFFGAGDVTTVPYKQIMIAIGEGSKASLSAFDYLIREE